jgi:hypothetical protein
MRLPLRNQCEESTMFKVNEKVYLDSDLAAPQVYIETRGLIVEKHSILLPEHKGASRWDVTGTNVPLDDGDSGTPDIYEIPEFTRQGGNILEIFVDLFNVTEDDQDFALKVEIHQGGYEPDILFDVSGTLGTTKGERTDTFGVFVPLRLMS